MSEIPLPMSEDAEKLNKSIIRIASASAGLAWSEHVPYNIASLMCSHTCSSLLVYLEIANTKEVELMVFGAISLALRQYYDKYQPRTEPAFNPPFEFIRKEVKAP